MSALDTFKDRWEDIRNAVKQRWGDKITDRDLDQVAHQRDELCHLIGEKCGLKQREANRELNAILDGITINSSYP